MIPLVFIKKPKLKLKSNAKPRPVSRTRRIAGSGLLTISMAVQGVFGGGTDSLVNIVLMRAFGMSFMHASIIKRWAQIVMNLTIIAGVIGSGLIVWNVAAVGVVTTFIGSFIGGNLAVAKGEPFMVHTMAAMMFVAAVALVVVP